MAESELPLSILKDIQEKLNSVTERVTELERKSPPPSPRVSLTPPRQEDGERENIEEEELFQQSDSEEEPDMNFKARVYAPPTGPPVSDKLANEIADSFLKKPDFKGLNDIQDNNPAPQNIASIRVPAMNSEISLIQNSSIWQKENAMTAAQKGICTSLSILTYTIADISKKRSHQSMSRHELFEKMNDCMSILVDAHKQISLGRRQNVKPLLNEPLHILCSKRSYVDSYSNEFLFGNDMDRQAEELMKPRRVMRRMQGNLAKNREN